MKFIKCSLAAVAMLAIATAATQNSYAALMNAGFETGPLVDDGSGIGKWQPFSGDGFTLATSAQDTTMPLTGTGHLALGIDNLANSFAGLFQDVSIAAGTPFTYSGYHKDNLGTNGAGIEIRVEYRDSVGDTEISRTDNLTPASLGGDYEPFAIDDVIPAGADTARVVYAIQSFGGAVDQSIFVDDTSVTIVPEPASIALIGLAGVAIASMRRRK